MLEERSYNGNSFRPTPVVHTENDGGLVIVATPWGAKSTAKKIIQNFQDYFLSARSDRESTSPFAKLTCISPIGNILRVGAYLANDSLYTEENREEYKTGVELLVLARDQKEISWVQVGQPQILLSRPYKPLHPLGCPIDCSSELAKLNPLPPLPAELLGLHSTSNIAVHSFRPQPGDRLLMISRNSLPPGLMQVAHEDLNLDLVSDILVADQPDTPFWSGILQF